MYIHNFLSVTPPYCVTQEECFKWLAEAHSIAEPQSKLNDGDYLKLLHRVGCSPQQIQHRYFFSPDVHYCDWDENIIYPIRKSARGVSMHDRHEFYHKTVRGIFENIYSDRVFPNDIVHVSCTGYISPSAAQIVAVNAPHRVTVTHSYHMGCYGAFPALRMASGFLSSPKILGKKKDIDIVHTELCSLHLNPQDSTLEQLVIQTLFADGCIAYSLSEQKPKSGFQLKSLYEKLLPQTADAMEWMVSDWGMKMTLSKDVPKMVGANIADFTRQWLHDAGHDFQHVQKYGLFAVHPGGPKIIDEIRDKLEITDEQVQASRNLLRDRGNMSSATLPHLWERILNDSNVPPGTPIVSFAFGPGLTICAGYMEKL